MRIIALLLVVVMLLSSFGCVTQSRRDWGYADTPGPQTTTTYVPLGNQVPPGVAQMQNTVTTTPPAFAQPYLAQNAAAANVNRMTYEHNSEEFDGIGLANVLVNAGFLGLGIVNTGLRWDHIARHPHWHGWW